MRADLTESLCSGLLQLDLTRDNEVDPGSSAFLSNPFQGVFNLPAFVRVRRQVCVLVKDNKPPRKTLVGIDSLVVFDEVGADWGFLFW